MSKMLWNYESVEPNVRLQSDNRSLRPIFHGSVILSYLLDQGLNEQDAFR